jgi:SAM-dependent methyltransferase
MINQSSHDETQFDEYAAQYDSALDHGISVSGEDKNYFAQGRVAWLSGCLDRLKEQPQSVMDWGCGTGSASSFLFGLLKAQSLIGVDTSKKSLEVAKRAFTDPQIQFLPLDEYRPAEQIDLVFCNGVFHHIPVLERPKAVDHIHRSLRPGGLFAFWENNPWNPGARLVMSRIPFDRDAIMVRPAEARRLLRARGFEVVRTDFLFIFPRVLRLIRPIEHAVSRLPLGAQYQVLARKV